MSELSYEMFRAGVSTETLEKSIEILRCFAIVSQSLSVQNELILRPHSVSSGTRTNLRAIWNQYARQIQSHSEGD